MPCLATLEGENDGEILDRLFDCNDEIGVVIYGPDTWNKVKNFVANLATKVIAQNRGKFGRWADRNCRVNKDSIDCAFGFNNSLGTALLGGEEWGRFVGRCKTAVRPLNGWSISDAFSGMTNLDNVVKWTKGALLPESFDAKGIVNFLTGWSQTKAGYESLKDVSGLSAVEQRAKLEKALKEEEARQRAQQNAENVLALQYAQAQLKAEAAKAEAEAKKAAQTPEAIQGRTQNIFIIGAIGLAAVALIAGGRK